MDFLVETKINFKRNRKEFKLRINAKYSTAQLFLQFVSAIKSATIEEGQHR